MTDISPFHASPITRAIGVAYVVLARSAIDETTRFLRDFGIALLSAHDDRAYYGSRELNETFYVVLRESRPRFVAFAMYVESETDLERLIAAGLAKQIERDSTPNDRPMVRMVDPNGIEVHAVVRPFEPTLKGTSQLESARPNTPAHAVRIDAPHAPVDSDPSVVRLGHVVLETIDFRRVVAWYQRVFGMHISDYQHLEDGTPVVAFCRCDRGEIPTDHHSIAIGQGFRVGLEHIAFEVDDIEAVNRGQHRMREGGWKHSWGVGRHIMGSQIFDYWYDACGTKHEHYADGDVVTSSYPMGYSPFGPRYLAQWGPPMPSDFVGGTASPRVVWQALSCVASGRLPLPTLVALIKAAKFPPKHSDA